MKRTLLLIPMAVLMASAQRGGAPAAEAPAGGGTAGAAAAPQAAAGQINNLDVVMKEIDDLMWQTKLGDIADVDKVEYTSLPPAHIGESERAGSR